MAIETKVLLQAHADYAIAIRDRRMYGYITRQLAVEGASPMSYDDAVKLFEDEDKDT